MVPARLGVCRSAAATASRRMRTPLVRGETARPEGRIMSIHSASDHSAASPRRESGRHGGGDADRCAEHTKTDPRRCQSSRRSVLEDACVTSRAGFVPDMDRRAEVRKITAGQRRWYVERSTFDHRRPARRRAGADRLRHQSNIRRGPTRPWSTRERNVPTSRRQCRSAGKRKKHGELSFSCSTGHAPRRSSG